MVRALFAAVFCGVLVGVNCAGSLSPGDMAKLLAERVFNSGGKQVVSAEAPKIHALARQLDEHRPHNSKGRLYFSGTRVIPGLSKSMEEAVNMYLLEKQYYAPRTIDDYLLQGTASQYTYGAYGAGYPTELYATKSINDYLMLGPQFGQDL